MSMAIVTTAIIVIAIVIATINRIVSIMLKYYQNQNSKNVNDDIIVVIAQLGVAIVEITDTIAQHNNDFKISQ